ncbi:ABC transporter family protein (macronuclear) [Tetrahymena thermophila SB210]|uniref:ABC transporter family protein n=1 Tax=Tetrahymena thermophila (strain SB210) TaxID=312017 RepID=Q229F2_TETTS|nr:ABC transporter family protein [Tetrahymena thermophila SB210]EAR81921.2 ABC transporter family protein [Tetrahymena thermophila SB210]|eukprot:XP_001029584.2 ABC transporter family protein [Tetrahymena thermophila SB210]
MGFSTHLKALMKKNFILWKRNICCSIFEILLPFFLVATFFILKSQVDDEFIPKKSFYPEKTILPPNYQNIGINPKTNFPIPPHMKDCLTGRSSQYPSYRNGHVATVGPDDFLLPLENIFQQNYNYQTKRYQSVDDLISYASSSDYNNDICFGISIDQYYNNIFKYRLLFNASSVTDSEVPQTIRPEVVNYLYENKKNNLDTWVNSGFLTIQNWIDNIILQYTTENSNLEIQSSITSMLVQDHYKNSLVDNLKGNMGVFIVLPMILIYLRMTYGLLIEKEKKIREGMKVMGMSNSSFYASWIIYYFIIYFLCSILVSSALKGSIYVSSDWSVIFVWHLIFGISLIFQSIFITTFFTKAQVGNIFAMVFFLFQYMAIIILSNYDNPSKNDKIGVSFLPQAGTSLACDVFLISESSKKGIQWSNLTEEIDNYSVFINIYMNLINIFIFIILGLYFDQVFPNDFGKKRHPLFFISWIWEKKLSPKEKKRKLLEKAEGEQAFDFNDNFEEVPQNLKDQEELNQTVKITNLRKIYPSGKSAVNGLSFSMYNGQIFALLGHNGAGKTSTISMLTGMYEMTDGAANALGRDVETEMEEIRTFMGVCPQYDILFDDLSVYEHLELFATFKGMTDSEEIKKQVQKHIEDVDLQEKTNELAKNLSGGQRRRLSVAIAFIGGSKLVYLDEPTSGMDTSARRHIWDMLKRYKNDRVICLTTHFMDEADYLGDRIGIMADGQLVCLGKPLFLKNKFGTGYNLTIVKKYPTDNSQPIIDFVKKHIKTAEVLSDVSAEVVLQLRNEEASNFPPLFLELDNSLQKLSIQTYGISITTLEEVFLKVAHLKEKKIKEQKKKEKLNEQEKDKSNSKNIYLNVDKSQDGNSDIESQKNQQNKISEDEKNADEIDNFDLNQVRITKTYDKFCYHMRALTTKRAISFKRDIRSLLCEVILPCLIVVVGLSLTLISSITEQNGVIIDPKNFPNPLNVVVGNAQGLSAPHIQNLLGSFSQANLYDFWTANQQSVDEWEDYAFHSKNYDSTGSYYIEEINISNTFKYTTEINTIYRDAAPLYINQMNEAYINYWLKQLGKHQITIQVTNHPLPLTQTQKDLSGSAQGLVTSFIYAIAFSFIPASLISFIVKERTEKIKHQQLVSGVSLYTYWFSNYLVDFIKYIIPAVFSILMILAYDISSFTESSCLAAISLMVFLYGWSVIPFSYFTSFIFGDYGNAQVSSFFINFLFGGIMPMVIFILRIIDSTESAAIAIGWIFRIIPSFSFGYGIMNIGNRNLYAFQNNYQQLDSPFSIDIAGADIIFMILEGFIYYLLVFLVENHSQISFLNNMFSKEKSVEYQPKEYDEDVQKEIDLIAETNPSDYTVRVNKLRKVFIPSKDRIKVAVDQVSFGIGNGECFTLLGVNGAGKTTTFKILSGEIQQTSGECHIMGFDLKTQINQARNYIGYCPQFDALCDNLTAREHLEMYALIKGIPIEMREKLVAKKIKEMDLTDFEHKLAGTYSGGNKRKLSVAIAMLGNPPIVFLDEPSTGMDPAARRFMWDVISRISTKRKSSSVILTTHSMEEAEALSTRVAIQVEGILRCIGSIQQIKDKFGEGYEVEIKLKIPTEQELIQKLSLYGITEDNVKEQIHYDQLESYLQQMNASNLNEQINAQGNGKQLYARLNSDVGVSLLSLAQYIVLEQNGENLKSFIQNKVGEYNIIEHFDDFYRFRILSDISIGKMFELFENNKNNLLVENYSVKQASIEQIFNLFATNQIKVNQQKLKFNVDQKNQEQSEQNSSQQYYGQKFIEMNQLQIVPKNNQN